MKGRIRIRSMAVAPSPWSVSAEDFLDLRILGTISHASTTTLQVDVGYGGTGAAAPNQREVQLLFDMVTGVTLPVDGGFKMG